MIEKTLVSFNIELKDLENDFLNVTLQFAGIEIKSGLILNDLDFGSTISEVQNLLAKTQNFINFNEHLQKEQYIKNLSIEPLINHCFEALSKICYVFEFELENHCCKSMFNWSPLYGEISDTHESLAHISKLVNAYIESNAQTIAKQDKHGNHEENLGETEKDDNSKRTYKPAVVTRIKELKQEGMTNKEIVETINTEFKGQIKPIANASALISEVSKHPKEYIITSDITPGIFGSNSKQKL